LTYNDPLNHLYRDWAKTDSQNAVVWLICQTTTVEQPDRDQFIAANIACNHMIINQIYINPHPLFTSKILSL